MNIKDALLSPNFRGHIPLWKVFWIYGVLFSHIYFFSIIMLFNRAGPVVMFLLLWGFIFYTLVIMRMVWVNARNTTRELYTFGARYLTAVWMVNSLVVTSYLYMTYFHYWKPLVDLP